MMNVDISFPPQILNEGTRDAHENLMAIFSRPMKLALAMKGWNAAFEAISLWGYRPRKQYRQERERSKLKQQLNEDLGVCRMVKGEENSIFISAFRGTRSSFLKPRIRDESCRVAGEYNTVTGNKPVRSLVRKLTTRHLMLVA